MNPNLLNMENAVGAIRVSSTKQGLQGDSPDDQKQQIERFAKTHNINIKKYFIFMDSASGEEQPVQEAIDYCKNPQNNIQLFVIKSIDRFTRGGSYFYDLLKRQLTKDGVRLIDLYGIIGSVSVNTLEHLDLEYPWSRYSPTNKAEILEAERAKDEIRDILTRMIGAEIRYVRMGYRVCLPPFGYVNQKIETAHGKRVILAPHPVESEWIIRMFNLRMRGSMTDYQIVDEINNLGFKTRKQYLRNPHDKTQIIGTKGEQPLSIKQLWRYIESPVYAGITVHKWTNGQPVKGNFEGLVSYEVFNEANRGKIVILEENGQVKLERRKPKDWQLKKLFKNPKFPYKRYVLCSICRAPLYGSASKGGSGKYYAAYHCGNKKGGHYYRVPIEEFDETIRKFVSGLHITERYIKFLRETVMTEWKKRLAQTEVDSAEIDKKIQELKLVSLNIVEKIRIVSSESVIKTLEADLAKIEADMATLEGEKENRMVDKINMEIVMDNVQYFLERFEDLLLGSPDPLKRAAYFGMLFKEPPTYQELLSRTAKLEPCIALNDSFLKDTGQTVSRLGIEPRTKRLKVSCSTAELPAHELKYYNATRFKKRCDEIAERLYWFSLKNALGLPKGFDLNSVIMYIVVMGTDDSAGKDYQPKESLKEYTTVGSPETTTQNPFHRIDEAMTRVIDSLSSKENKDEEDRNRIKRMERARLLLRLGDDNDPITVIDLDRDTKYVQRVMAEFGVNPSLPDYNTVNRLGDTKKHQLTIPPNTQPIIKDHPTYIPGISLNASFIRWADKDKLPLQVRNASGGYGIWLNVNPETAQQVSRTSLPPINITR